MQLKQLEKNGELFQVFLVFFWWKKSLKATYYGIFFRSEITCRLLCGGPRQFVWARTRLNQLGNVNESHVNKRLFQNG